MNCSSHEVSRDSFHSESAWHASAPARQSRMPDTLHHVIIPFYEGVDDKCVRAIHRSKRIILALQLLLHVTWEPSQWFSALPIDHRVKFLFELHAQFALNRFWRAAWWQTVEQGDFWTFFLILQVPNFSSFTSFPSFPSFPFLFSHLLQADSLETTQTQGL